MFILLLLILVAVLFLIFMLQALGVGLRLKMEALESSINEKLSRSNLETSQRHTELTKFLQLNQSNLESSILHCLNTLDNLCVIFSNFATLISEQPSRLQIQELLAAQVSGLQQNLSTQFNDKLSLNVSLIKGSLEESNLFFSGYLDENLARISLQINNKLIDLDESVNGLIKFVDDQPTPQEVLRDNLINFPTSPNPQEIQILQRLADGSPAHHSYRPAGHPDLVIFEQTDGFAVKYPNGNLKGMW